MKRREFVRKSIGAGIAAGSVMAINPVSPLWGRTRNNPLQNYDLVAVKGGEPDVMFDKAIASLGGNQEWWRLV